MVEELDCKTRSLENKKFYVEKQQEETRAEGGSIFIGLCKEFDKVILLAC